MVLAMVQFVSLIATSAADRPPRELLTKIFTASVFTANTFSRRTIMQTRKVDRTVRWASIAAVVGLGAFSIPMIVHASSGPEGNSNAPTEVTVKGEVVDLWCYMDHKGHGQKHKSCAVTCAEAGNPIGIAESSGHLYIAMGGKKHQPGREVLIDHMAETVTVKGKLVKDGGLEAIYITSVEK